MKALWCLLFHEKDRRSLIGPATVSYANGDGQLWVAAGLWYFCERCGRVEKL